MHNFADDPSRQSLFATIIRDKVDRIDLPSEIGDERMSISMQLLPYKAPRSSKSSSLPLRKRRCRARG